MFNCRVKKGRSLINVGSVLVHDRRVHNWNNKVCARVWVQASAMWIPRWRHTSKNRHWPGWQLSLLALWWIFFCFHLSTSLCVRLPYTTNGPNKGKSSQSVLNDFVIVSTKPDDQIHRLTFWTRKSTEPRTDDENGERNRQDNEGSEENKAVLKAMYAVCCLSRQQEQQEEDGTWETQESTKLGPHEAAALLEESRKWKWYVINTLRTSCIPLSTQIFFFCSGY